MQPIATTQHTDMHTHDKTISRVHRDDRACSMLLNMLTCVYCIVFQTRARVRIVNSMCNLLRTQNPQ